LPKTMFRATGLPVTSEAVTTCFPFAENGTL
jgi:hypothetical protein